jgi:hypothetical protein
LLLSSKVQYLVRPITFNNIAKQYSDLLGCIVNAIAATVRGERSTKIVNVGGIRFYAAGGTLTAVVGRREARAIKSLGGGVLGSACAGA